MSAIECHAGSCYCFFFLSRAIGRVFFIRPALNLRMTRRPESSSAQHSRAQFSDAFVCYCFSFFFLFFASFVSAFVCRPKPRPSYPLLVFDGTSKGFFPFRSVIFRTAVFSNINNTFVSFGFFFFFIYFYERQDKYVSNNMTQKHTAERRVEI